MCEIYADSYTLTNCPNSSIYKLGFQAGQRDAKLISNPINTNGHTFDQYLTIKNLYEEAIYSVDNWSRGYAEGFDDWCLKNKN